MEDPNHGRKRPHRTIYLTLGSALRAYARSAKNTAAALEILQQVNFELIEAYEGQAMVRIRLANSGGSVRIYSNWIVGHLGHDGQMLRLKLPD